MLFTISFILFFTLDILAISRFQVLGMIPTHYLTAGVGFFLCVFLVKHRHFWGSKGILTIALMLFWGYVFLIAVSNLLMASSRVLITLGFIDSMLMISDMLIMVVSVIFFFVFLFILPAKHPISKWILLSTAAGFLHYVIDSFIRLPVLLWRYSGVLDLFILFGWLMVIDIMLRMEFDIDIASYPGTLLGDRPQNELLYIDRMSWQEADVAAPFD